MNLVRGGSEEEAGATSIPCLVILSLYVSCSKCADVPVEA
jgi:hypothetical protein